MLDIGHGGTNPATGQPDYGAVVSEVREHDVNLMVADEIAQLAPRLSPWAELVGYTPQVYSHIKRATAARESRADLVISLHCNASPTGDPREHGTLVFWDPDRIATAQCACRVATASSVRGGEYLEAGKVQPMTSHQIKARRDPHWTGRAYRVLSAYTSQGVNAILIELDYLTNPHGLAWLTSTEGRRQAAHIVCTALERRITR